MMRHSPQIRTTLVKCKCIRSAQSGQGEPASKFPSKHHLRQQWRRASTFHAIVNRPGRRTNTPRIGSIQSQTSTRLPVPASQQLDQLACLIRIQPQPTSIIYTTAILTHLLRRFGSVLEFRPLDGPSSRNSESSARVAGSVYRTRFANESSLLKALEASPLDVDVGSGGRASSGNEENNRTSTHCGATTADTSSNQPPTTDPYNVFGLRDRHTPQPCSFTCTIQRAHHTASSPTSSSPSVTAPTRQALARHKDTQILYESLLASGAPADLAWVLALEPRQVPVTETAITREEKEREKVTEEEEARHEAKHEADTDLERSV